MENAFFKFALKNSFPPRIFSVEKPLSKKTFGGIFFMKKPYFSIIIPCLNEENFISDLLKNLNSQSFKDFEVVIVDGKSQDNTVKVIKDFPAKYPFSIHSTSTRNVAFQRNLGAKKAKGDIFIFFDADTQIPNNYLKKIQQAFDKKKPHFLTTYVKVDSKSPIELMFAFFCNLVFETGKVFKIPFSFGAMQAVKRGAFFDIGGYDVKTKFAEDSQLFQNLYDYHYKLLILTYPRFYFSLRRFRAEGVLKSLTQYLQLNFNILLRGYHVPPKVRYQMGGKRYDIEQINDVKYSHIFQPFFVKLNKAIKKRRKNTQLFVDKIFSSK